MNARTYPLSAMIALASGGCHAFGYQGLTARQVDCQAREIEVSHVTAAGSATTWNASCRGKTYLCGGDAEGNVVCKDTANKAAVVPPSIPAASAPPQAAPAAAPQGCQYDTQCKGERICVGGTCVEPQVKAPNACEARPSAAQRACTQPSDCSVVQVPTDCCGTTLATGIRADAKASFAATVGRCEGPHGLCECVAEPTRRDDGSNAADELETTADCVNALCTTRAVTAAP